MGIGARSVEVNNPKRQDEADSGDRTRASHGATVAGSLSIAVSESAEQLLLKSANLLLRAGTEERTDSFNLFTVLRSGSDEVNLHSRFLHAVLDHKTGKRRQNLSAFLTCVGLHDAMSDLNPDRADIHREKKNIDVWIADRFSGCAVVIENKIYAGDQPAQLEQYDCKLTDDFAKRRLIYLTLDGHQPTKQSQGCVPDERIICIKYVDLLPWLDECSHLAVDEPALRSAITQYRRLIHDLTGGGLGGVELTQLKELIRETRSFLVARNLGKAADAALPDIVGDLWVAIGRAVTEEFKSEALSGGVPSIHTKERIKEAFGLSDKKRNLERWHGLYYPLNQRAEGKGSGLGPALSIEISRGHFWLGIRCWKSERAYSCIQELLSREHASPDLKPTDWWPWRTSVKGYPHLNDERIGALDCDKERTRVAQGIAKELRGLWNALKEDETRRRDLF